ncbi:MAG TPA: hypothetical protein VGG28_20395 [Kofleriaceae bacterium]
MIVVVIVAAAWTAMEQQGQLDNGWSQGTPTAMFMVAACYFGLPLGLACGTIIGKLAGRLIERRWFVHVATIVCTLVVALPAVAILHRASMIVVALMIAIPASVMLERSTRPEELLPHARVA